MPDRGGRCGSFNTSTGDRGNDRHWSGRHADSHRDRDPDPGRLANINPGTGLADRAVDTRHSVSNSRAGRHRHPYAIRGNCSGIGWESGVRPFS